MKIRYNSPVILTFSIVVVLVQLVDTYLIPEFTKTIFLVGGTISFIDPLDYFRLFSHVLGHTDWEHLLGNLTFVLLLGPILEERYGSDKILIMIGVTALFTGILNVAIFSTGLLGASGVVFMLIILVSIVNMKKGEIPLTFLLVATIFIGKELIGAITSDNVSQMAHVAGGTIGSIFGFSIRQTNRENELAD